MSRLCSCNNIIITMFINQDVSDMIIIKLLLCPVHI